VIRTITLNTGFDEFYIVDDIEFGGVRQVRSHYTLASGKGINAARVACALGARVTAYGLVGKNDQERFGTLLQDAHVESRLVTVD
jgi:fructose-1-phosphate kinase PfkB-like protein